MMQRITSRPPATPLKDTQEELPLSLLLFRYVWPFWLFRDASQRNQLARTDAYRHNRGARVHLPSYLMKWLIGTALMLWVSCSFASLSSHSSGTPDVFLILAAGAGMLFAIGVCMLLVMGSAYLFLSLNAH